MKMNAIIVDDERLAVEALEDACEEIGEITIQNTFLNPLAALAYLQTTLVDIVFLDIEMPDMNGIHIARKLREVCADVVIIFVTGYKQYALEAFGVNAFGYLVKPFVVEDVQKVIDNILRLKKCSDKIYIRTFGRFDVFINGQAVKFHSRKSKELLALLVDQRGSIITMEQIIDTLWLDEVYGEKQKVKYRKACMNLRSDLSAARISQILITSRAQLGVNCNMFSCDYYRFLDNPHSVANTFVEDYLCEYSWAEPTVAKLEQIKNKLSLSQPI